MVAVPTTCPFCSCGCGFYLLAKEGQLVGTERNSSGVRGQALRQGLERA